MKIIMRLETTFYEDRQKVLDMFCHKTTERGYEKTFLSTRKGTNIEYKYLFFINPNKRYRMMNLGNKTAISAEC